MAISGLRKRCHRPTVNAHPGLPTSALIPNTPQPCRWTSASNFCSLLSYLAGPAPGSHRRQRQLEDKSGGLLSIALNPNLRKSPLSRGGQVLRHEERDEERQRGWCQRRRAELPNLI